MFELKLNSKSLWVSHTEIEFPCYTLILRVPQIGVKRILGEWEPYKWVGFRASTHIGITYDYEDKYFWTFRFVILGFGVSFASQTGF